MALMGGSSKGYGHSNSSGNRGRAYGMLLLLAFGAAVFGVMLLHKLRERRVFDLLLKDKDRELLSLQFLLQKERVTTKEVKRKMEEVKTKINSLRTQKTQLNNRIADMQSMTSSLKQEHRALESALEKMQNENNILREKDISSAKENPEIVALKELLKQKEAEIKEMKDRLETPTKIWSVSADDPSNPPVNLTTTGTTVEENENEVGKSKKANFTAEYQQLQELNVKDGQNSTSRHEAENGTGIEGKNQTVIPREEQLQTWDNNPVGENTTQRGASMQDSTQRGDNGENNADDHQGEGQIGDGGSEKPEVPQEDRDPKGRNQSNGNERNMDEKSHDDELLKTGDAEVIDEDHGAIRNGEILKLKSPAEVIDEDHGAIRNGEIQKPKNPQDSDGRELGMNSKGEIKLEVHSDVSQIDLTSRTRGRSRSKKGQRRRRMISGERELEKSGNSKEALGDEHDQENAVMREGQGEGHSEMHDKSKNEVLGITTNTDNQVVSSEDGEGAVSNTRRLEMPMHYGDVEGLVGKHGLRESSDSELLKSHNLQHDEDSESTYTANRVGKEQEISHLKLQDSEDGDGLTIEQKLDVERLQEDQEAIEQKLDGGRLQEEQEARAVEKLVDRDTTGKGKGKDANRNEEAENMEVDGAGEQTTETEDDIPGILDLELDDIEQHRGEGNTEDEEF
ncbi:trichohyalin-like isoform X2 [Telopea speciosissima]|uniref:trichohyalin-like isoform X2 n=1 Tax=Telopea speciosissima TaxID=54955 RepID=UPI001CC5393E|nr:trichohyalin-like isoform X2 [Telopea speciosissima]